MAYIGRQPVLGEIIRLNSIESSFNGSDTTFNLTRTVSGSTINFYPVSSEQLFVSLGGVIQEPDPTGDTGFKINYNQIVFAVPPAAGTSCFIIAYGNILDVGTPADGTVTPEKLSTGGPYWDTSGNLGLGNLSYGGPSVLLHLRAETGEMLRLQSNNLGLGATSNIRLLGSRNDTLGLSITQYGSTSGSTNSARIFNESLGDLRFGTNNEERLRITSTGNVGIGTTDPSGRLINYTSSTRYQGFQDNLGDLAIISDNNSTPIAYIKGTGTADLLNVFDNTTEVFTILDGGNVGIGTDNPETILHIKTGQNSIITLEDQDTTVEADSLVGALYFKNLDTDNGGINAYAGGYNEDTTGAMYLSFGTGTSNSATERLRITSDGTILIQDSVSLGANAPGIKGKIRISGASDKTTAGGIEFHTSSGGGAGYGSRITSDATGDMRFHTRNNSSVWSERLRITSGGKVGIGTDSPLTELDARGSTEAGITVGTTSQFYGRLYGSSTLTFVGAYNGADLSFSTSTGTSYNSKMMIKNGGNVGIGTADPSQPLVVENSGTNILLLLKATGSSAARLFFKNTGMTSDGDTQIWSQNNDLVFNTSNSERVRIDNNGKVGIGTDDPDGGDLLGTPALTVYGTDPILNIAQSQDFDSDADIAKLVFAANDPRTTSSQNGRQMALIKARWIGSSTNTLNTSLSIYTAQDGNAAASHERVRITPDYGLTGNIVERFIPPGIYYYNAGTPGLIENSSMFFSANAAMMNETGDRVWFGGWPTAYAHKKFVAVRMIYHGAGNVNGTVWSISADIYWAVSLQGYTQNGTTINFDLPSISNGKVYIKDITSIWPVIGADRIVNSQFTFTENIGGSTIGITGLQIVEATNPYG